MVGGVNFRQSWAWMSDGSGFSGSWERLTGIEATQDEVKEGLFGKGRGKMDPDASSGLSDAGPDLEDTTTQGFDFELVPRGSVQIVAQAHEHLVSQCMQEESKLIGQESMTTESVHAQVILKGLDEVLGLPSVCVVVIK